MAFIFRKFFELINIFKFHVGFNYKRKKSYHSFFGFLLSWIIIIASGFLVFLFSDDMIYKKNPNVIYSESIQNSSEIFKLKDLIKKVEFEILNNNNDKNFEIPNDIRKIFNFTIRVNNQNISVVIL